MYELMTAGSVRRCHGAACPGASVKSGGGGGAALVDTSTGARGIARSRVKRPSSRGPSPAGVVVVAVAPSVENGGRPLTSSSATASRVAAAKSAYCAGVQSDAGGGGGDSALARIVRVEKYPRAYAASRAAKTAR